MSQRDTVYKLFSLQPGEGRTVLLFIAYSLFMGLAVAVFYTCTTSLFLTNFSRTELPLAFVAGGLLIYGLGLAVRPLQRTTSFRRMNGYLLAFLLISVAGLLLASNQMPNRWLYFVLFLWNRVFVFVNGITFWATASRIFNFQQAKRLFSFISMGDVISSVLSYFSVPVLLSFISTETLLVVSLLSLVVCAGLLLVITNRFEHKLSDQPEQQQPLPETNGSEAKVHQRYYTLLYVLAFLTVFGLAYVEFMFTVQLKEVFPNRELLASFLGIFFGMCAIIELGIKGFLYNRLIGAYSIRIGIIMLPLALLFSYTLTALYGALFGATSLLLAFIALSRFFMSSVRRSISEPAFQVLFQPIPPAERTRLQSRIEGVPKALGNVLAGLVLLALTNLSFVTLVELSYAFLLVIVFWSIVSFRVQVDYQNILTEAVARSSAYVRRSLTTSRLKSVITPPVDSSLRTSHAFDDMVKLVQSNRPLDRIRAATELGQSGRYAAYRYLLPLLHDAHPAVRRAALLAAGALRKPELWPRLFDQLTTNEYHETASVALGSIGERVVPALARFFNQTGQSKDVQVRCVGIINDIGGEAALRFLRSRINHPVPVVRNKVFEGLHALHHRATVTERPAVLLQLDEQIALLVWLTAARADLTSYARHSALLRALDDEEQLVVPTIFNLLATLSGDNRFDGISELITQNNDEINGYLIELLGTALPTELKGSLLPLFTNLPPDEKVRRSALTYPQQTLSVEARLHDIINKDFGRLTPRFKAVAIGELLNGHQTDPTAILVANAASPNELIAETAFYVLRVLNPTRFAELHQALRLLLDAQCRIADYVANGLTEAELQVRRDDALFRKTDTVYEGLLG